MPRNMLQVAASAANKGFPAWRAAEERRKLDLDTQSDEADLQDIASALCNTLSKAQKDVYEDTARFKYLMAGRRFGKTYLALTRLLTWSLQTPNGLFYYVTATYRMAKQIAWVDLKRMVPLSALKFKNEQELSIELTNGARIYLKGAEDPDRLRGVSLSGCVIDEAAYVRQEAWTMVLRPALSDQQGPAWFITTPAGENWFTDALKAAETGEDPEGSGFRFTTADGGRVAQSEIDAARRTLGPDLFRQEYGAEIVDLRGLAIFRREWFNYYNPQEVSLSKHSRLLCSVDANFKEGESNDYVGITIWSVIEGKFYLMGIENQKIGYVDTLSLIRTLWNRWKFSELLVEDKANGSAIIDQLKREANGYAIHACNPLGGKIARGNAAAPSYEQGIVLHPSGSDPRLRVLEDQLLSLNVRDDGHDDLADSVTQAICHLTGTGPMRISTVHYGRSSGIPSRVDVAELKRLGFTDDAIKAIQMGYSR